MKLNNNYDFNKATIRYKGYDPNDLKDKSNKRICVSCDRCGRVRYVAKGSYRDLCYNCTHGKNNSNWAGRKMILTCKQCKKNL